MHWLTPPPKSFLCSHLISKPFLRPARQDNPSKNSPQKIHLCTVRIALYLIFLLISIWNLSMIYYKKIRLRNLSKLEMKIDFLSTVFVIYKKREELLLFPHKIQSYFLKNSGILIDCSFTFGVGCGCATGLVGCGCAVATGCVFLGTYTGLSCAYSFCTF